MKLGIRQYKKSDIPFMKALWKSVYLDGEKHIDGFMSTVLPVCKCLIFSFENNDVGAAYLVPASSDSDIKYYYLYGCCVAEEFREYGVMTNVVSKLRLWAKRNNSVFYIKPENIKAARLCMHCGLEPYGHYGFAQTRESKPTVKGANMTVKEMCAGDYAIMRRKYFDKYGKPCFCSEFLAFGLGDFSEKGGSIVKISYGYVSFYALVSKVCGGIVLNEALTSKCEAEKLLPYLCHRYSVGFAGAFTYAFEGEYDGSAGFVIR